MEETSSPPYTATAYKKDQYFASRFALPHRHWNTRAGAQRPWDTRTHTWAAWHAAGATHTHSHTLTWAAWHAAGVTHTHTHLGSLACRRFGTRWLCKRSHMTWSSSGSRCHMKHCILTRNSSPHLRQCSLDGREREREKERKKRECVNRLPVPGQRWLEPHVVGTSGQGQPPQLNSYLYWLISFGHCLALHKMTRKHTVHTPDSFTSTSIYTYNSSIPVRTAFWLLYPCEDCFLITLPPWGLLSDYSTPMRTAFWFMSCIPVWWLGEMT